MNENHTKLVLKAAEAAVAAHDFIQNFNAYLLDFGKRVDALLAQCPLTPGEKAILQSEEITQANIGTRLKMLSRYPDFAKEVSDELPFMTAFTKFASQCAKLCTQQLELTDISLEK